MCVCVCLSVWQSNWQDQSSEENAGNAGVWNRVREWTVNQLGLNVGNLPSLQKPHPAPSEHSAYENSQRQHAGGWKRSRVIKKHVLHWYTVKDKVEKKMGQQKKKRNVFVLPFIKILLV